MNVPARCSGSPWLLRYKADLCPFFQPNPAVMMKGESDPLEEVGVIESTLLESEVSMDVKLGDVIDEYVSCEEL